MARYNVRQVAQMWGVTANTIYNMIERRELSCVKIGKTIRFCDEDLAEYEAYHVQKSAPPVEVEQPALEPERTRSEPAGSKLDVEALARRIRGSR